ncbi:MAG: hypothetical protein OXF49_03295 [Candidatus Saccharibacteria bacterium]|nr:hypothetical protein [Candidatus Saccharibacteria bacterium]
MNTSQSKGHPTIDQETILTMNMLYKIFGKKDLVAELVCIAKNTARKYIKNDVASAET